MRLIRALLSARRTNVSPLLRETGHRGRGTSPLKSAARMTTGPHTFPTTDSCRTLSCIITRCDLDNPKRVTCETSRRHRHTSCRGAEHDFLSTLLDGCRLYSADQTVFIETHGLTV